MSKKKRRRKEAGRGRPGGYRMVPVGQSGTAPASATAADGLVQHWLDRFSLDSLVTRAHEATARNFMQGLRAPVRESPTAHDRRTAQVIGARQVVREAIVRRAGRSSDGVDMTPGDFDHAAQLVWDWISAGEMERLDADPEALPEVTQRIIASQYEDQLALMRLPRYFALARRTIEKAEEKGLPLAARFSQKFGLTFEEFVRTSSIVTRWAATGIPLDEHPMVDVDLLGRFWERCALDYDRFAEHANSPGVSFPGLGEYGLSPTIMWPVIRRTDGAYVVPVMHDLFYRASRSFPFDAREAVGRSSHERLDNVRGLAFESLVGDLLGGTSGAGSVRHADDVLLPHTVGKRCDWVCVEGRGGRATLVEAKASQLPRKTAILPTPENRRAHIEREGGLADAVAQLDDTARAIRDGNSSLSSRTKLIGLVVVDGPQIMLNDETTREAVSDVLRARNRPDPIVRYQVSTSDGLTRLALSASTGGSMWERLDEKYRRDRSSDMDRLTLPPDVSSVNDHPILKGWVEEMFPRDLLAEEHRA